MALILQSQGIWSATLERQTVTLIRPGAPLLITSLALGQALELPKSSNTRVLRSVVHLSHRTLDQERGTTAIIGSLIPEKTENFTCHIVLFPNTEYKFEVYGNPVHLLGRFDGDIVSTTEVRLLRRAPSPIKRSNSVLSTATNTSSGSVRQSDVLAPGFRDFSFSFKAGPEPKNLEATTSKAPAPRNPAATTSKVPAPRNPATTTSKVPAVLPETSYSNEEPSVAKRHRIWGVGQPTTR